MRETNEIFSHLTTINRENFIEIKLDCRRPHKT